METEDSSPSSKQPTTCAEPRQHNHGQNLRYYFWKINFNIILPSAPSYSKLSPSFTFPIQNATRISLLPLCVTPFPPLIILHLINTNNIWSGARIMRTIFKQIFPSFCHFLRVWSKYLPHYPISDYLQSLFVRQTGRPSFTPICKIRCNYSSLIKRSSKLYVICWQKKIEVQKSTSTNFNSTFSVFSVFNA